MDNMTLGQVGLILAAIVAFIKGIEYLYNLAKKGATNWFKSLLEPINNSIETLSNKIDEVDMNATKNFLVRFLADVEQGNEIDEIEKERFYEEYKHYTDLGGNSYVKDKVEKLKKRRKAIKKGTFKCFSFVLCKFFKKTFVKVFTFIIIYDNIITERQTHIKKVQKQKHIKKKAHQKIK